MRAQWQKKLWSEEVVPTTGGPTTLEPPEDIDDVMAGRLFLVPEVKETGAKQPLNVARWIDLSDSGFAFARGRNVKGDQNTKMKEGGSKS
jgi:hypothetical protein